MCTPVHRESYISLCTYIPHSTPVVRDVSGRMLRGRHSKDIAIRLAGKLWNAMNVINIEHMSIQRGAESDGQLNLGGG